MRKALGECTKILKQESKKLRNQKGKKERHLSERSIAMARQRYDSFKTPKTALDHKYLDDHIAKCRMPRAMMNLCIEHAASSRKTLLKREMALRTSESEKFQRELQCWSDIDSALQMLNPEAFNPAPKPEPPVERPLHFLIPREKVTQIVKRLRQWWEENKAALNGQAGDDEPRTPKVTGELKAEHAAAVSNIVCTLILTSLEPI